MAWGMGCVAKHGHLHCSFPILGWNHSCKDPRLVLRPRFLSIPSLVLIETPSILMWSLAAHQVFQISPESLSTLTWGNIWPQSTLAWS